MGHTRASVRERDDPSEPEQVEGLHMQMQCMGDVSKTSV